MRKNLRVRKKKNKKINNKKFEKNFRRGGGGPIEVPEVDAKVLLTLIALASKTLK